MTSYLCLSVHFLDPAFHGRGDGAASEWPPSPLRLFQALVAASAARWGKRHQLDYARPALRWLEGESPPVIVAVPSMIGAGYRLSVPNNAMDLVGRAWSRGNTTGTGDANPATHRAMKTVRPTRLLDDDAVHYLWELSDLLADDVRGHVETLSAAARSVVALGWGVDLVAAHGQVLSDDDAGKLPGERWRPTSDPGARGLRVPTPGTLDALASRHEAFLHRLDGDGFTPVPALTAFATVGYRRDTDVSHRPVAAFEICRPIVELAELPASRSKFRPFDAVRWGAAVAGMVRHATATGAQQAGWSAERINTFVQGHTIDGTAQAHGQGADRRLSYIPLPSLERRGTSGVHVGMIRRVLVVGPSGGSQDIAWVRRALSGQELFAEGREDPIAMLSVIPETDRNVRPYIGPSAVWSTVTPVILPGYDDRDSEKTERLLRSTLDQAGFPSQLRDRAVLEWRPVGFRPGLDLAVRYRVGSRHERFPRHHVRITWPVPVRGPLCLGVGRYYGMGLFAAEEPARPT